MKNMKDRFYEEFAFIINQLTDGTLINFFSFSEI